MARDEGWLAEHMLILKLTSPEGEVKYVTGAFPSACGKTNLAMLIPTLPGWKVETVGDDIAWMKFGDDGRLYAINPEAGFFGVAPGHRRTRPTRTRWPRSSANSIFTNCALTDDGDVWWEGMTGEPPDARDRLEGQRLDARLRGARRAPERPLHDARRRSAPRSPPSGRTRPACRSTPSCSAAAARRVVPLVTESFDWEHGVFLGATMSLGDDRRRRRRGRQAALRPDGDAAVLRLQHGRLLRATGWRSAPRAPGRAAADLLRQLVPQGRRRQVHLARLRREQPRARVGLPPLRRRGRDGRDADRPRAAPRASSTPTGSRSPTRQMRELLTVDPDALRGAAAAGRGAPGAGSATTCRTRSARSSRR